MPEICPFCLDQDNLPDHILSHNDYGYIMDSEDPVLQQSVMVIPYRHVETPFELNDAEWLATKQLLDRAKALLDPNQGQGYTIGWNVSRTAGQHVPHVHLHVIARFADEPLAGQGLRHAFKQPGNRRPTALSTSRPRLTHTRDYVKR